MSPFLVEGDSLLMAMDQLALSRGPEDLAHDLSAVVDATGGASGAGEGPKFHYPGHRGQRNAPRRSAVFSL